MTSEKPYESQLTKGYDEKLESGSDESSQPQALDPDRLAEEKRLVRKLDKRILPIACLLYLFACASYIFPFFRFASQYPFRP